MLLTVQAISVTKLYLTFLFCTKHLLQFKCKPDRNGWQYFFVKNLMEEGKYIYIIYISCMYVHFDAHDSDQNKEKGKKKEENIHFTFFVMS